MSQVLSIYNSYTKQKEAFEPLNPPFVGMYVCGPTVYGDPHLGHARAAINFDVLYRYLLFLGYKVRYVRNITDVGHLENDADEGEDKIIKKARLEKKEPMEIAQYYTRRYHEALTRLNCLPPSIEPLASGHIIEQIELVEKILEKGFAYKTENNVYFDLKKYVQKYPYGKLSGKVIDELINQSRELKGQEDKKHPVDFALWKKADERHIMKWKSPWNEGYPGWHTECSAMGIKYLGIPFDIHGGGLDLMFPHHESEIAQSMAAYGQAPCKYWIHNNLITINGQKMAKSLGNFITLEEIFTGQSHLLEQAYSPAVVRFFILQAHYRSTIDFSNEALKSASKGLHRLIEAYRKIDHLPTGNHSDFNYSSWAEKCFAHLNDDLNTARLIASLFEAVNEINKIHDGKSRISQEDKAFLKKHFDDFLINILGIEPESNEDTHQLTSSLIDLIVKIRSQARQNKDWKTSDYIRDRLLEMGIQLKDGKEGTTWTYL